MNFDLHGYNSVLVKYLKTEHAFAMVYDGAFRIGTFYDYKRYDQKFTDVADCQEGMFYFDTGESFSSGDLPHTPAPMQQLVERVITGDFHIQGSTTWGVDFGDCYVYSLTQDYCPDPEIMRRIDPSYDACVRITDAENFFKTLHACLNEAVGKPLDCGVDTCVYEPRRKHWKDERKYNPAFVKAPGFAYQMEVRAVWAAEGTISPLFLRDCRAKDFCTIEWYSQPGIT
jgi:hypothetical protein